DKGSRVFRMRYAHSIREGSRSTNAYCIRIGRNAGIADVDIVSATAHGLASELAQGNVLAAAKAEPERIDAKSRVCDAAGVVVKRGKTVGCVAEPGGFLKERLKTVGRVSDSGCVRSERWILD